jgi:hypothetical protein
MATGAVIGRVAVTQSMIDKTDSFINAARTKNLKEASLAIAELILEVKTLDGAGQILATGINESAMDISRKELFTQAAKATVKECTEAGLDKAGIAANKKRVAMVAERTLASYIEKWV